MLAVDLMMFAGVEHALHTAGLVGMVLHYTLVCLINIGVIPLNASTMNREFFCYDKLTQTSVHKCMFRSPTPLLDTDDNPHIKHTARRL